VPDRARKVVQRERVSAVPDAVRTGPVTPAAEPAPVKAEREAGTGSQGRVIESTAK